MLKEFRAFVMRGNMLDLAVGIVMGVAFLAIVQSLVADVIMPPIGLLLGKVDFANLFAVLKPGATPGPYASLAQAKAAGAVTLNYGQFLNTIVSFLIVAAAVFLIVRSVNRLRAALGVTAEAVKQPCPHCLSSIPVGATRCAFCASDLKATAG